MWFSIAAADRLSSVAATYSTRSPADLTTFSHFAVSAAIMAPKACGEEISGSPPSRV
jgi:hypothetical protein